MLRSNSTLTRLTLALAMGAVTVACGDVEDPDAPSSGPANLPSALLVRQDSLTVSEFQGLAAAIPELGAVAASVDVVSAGEVEDSDGVVVTWGEGSDGRTSAIRHCKGSDCVSVVQQRTGNDVSWTDANGQSIAVRGIGRPILLKNLDGHNLDDTTSLATGALQIDPLDLPGVDFQTRRFVALNTFGGVFGVSMNQILSEVDKIGGHHEIVEVQYAREYDVFEALTTLDHLDTVVWLTQGIREETKSGWENSRTIGLTVNRGIFGEATMDRNALAEPAQFNIAGGPGIIFLAGSQTAGDGSTLSDPDATVWGKFFDANVPVSGGRIIIGVEGHADVGRILTATSRFFTLYLSGEISLGDAMDAANKELAATAAILRTNIWGDELQRTHLRAYTDVWTEAPYAPAAPPTSARVSIPMTAVTQCKVGGGSFQPISEDFATAWADVTFDGAYFEGTRQMKISDTFSVDTHIRGMITGFEVDDHVYFETWGNMDKSAYQDFHAFGEGLVTGVDTESNADGETTYHVRFVGPVHGAPFKNEAGEECLQVGPQISTTAGDHATFMLTP